MNLTSLLSVALGAALGGLSRFLISYWGKEMSSKFPFSTCIINLAGSFLLGLILASSLKHGMSNAIKLFLTTGFCGGFTTFSTFSMEWLSMMQQGHLLLSVIYVLVSVIGGLVFAWMGFRLI